jgi:tetratricopeptide (TPR) repeat protein
MESNIIDLLKTAIKEHQKGKLDKAEMLYREVLNTEPRQSDANHNLGLILTSKNKMKEALILLKVATEVNPNIEQYWISYINALIKQNRLEEAETIYKKILTQQPESIRLHFNLGVVLQNLDKLPEAEASYRKVIELNPDHSEAYNNLGTIFYKNSNFKEAEVNIKKAIELKPDYVEANYHLGSVLQNLDKLPEAEASYRKVIELKPDHIEAHNNLGTILQNNGQFEDAEEIFRNITELKPDLIEVHENLGTLLKFKTLSLKIREVKKNYKNNNIGELVSPLKLTSNFFTSNREVETELIKCLYEIKSKELSQTKGVFFGSGRHSVNFRLFEQVSKDNYSIIKKAEKDLTTIMKQAVNSDIFIMDSFFNILNNGGGSNYHTHLSKFDKINKLVKQKYSLTYYLTVGDQNCSEPGILKMKNPDDEILPHKGMIMIFPASRSHSAVYNGKVDRVMIGVNFYSLI